MSAELEPGFFRCPYCREVRMFWQTMKEHLRYSHPRP